LNIEDSICIVPLREYDLLLWNRQNLPAIADGREEGVRIESAVFLDYRREFHSMGLCSLMNLAVHAAKVHPEQDFILES
jgi:hypothetical protein